MKKFISRSFIGIFVGSFVAVLVTNVIFLFGDLEMINGSLFLKDSVGYMVCGWFFSVSPMYFKIRRLKLFQQTALHFLTIMVLYVPLALIIGWIPFNLIRILLTIIIAIVVYTLSWIAFYMYFKYQARELNDDLKKL